MIGLLAYSQVSSSENKLRFDDMYSFVQPGQTIEFHIESPQLDEVTKKKLHLKSDLNISARVKKSISDAVKVDLLGNITEISLEIKVKLKEIFKNKSKLILGTDFREWISDYKFLKKEGDRYLYKKIFQDGRESKLDIQKLKNKLVVKNISTEFNSTTTYFLFKPKWSYGKNVISRIENSIIEGEKKSIVNAAISYKKQSKRFWIPNKLKLNTKQILNYSQNKQIERVIEEEFFFSNFNLSSQAHK